MSSGAIEKIVIRSCHDLEELRACVALQQEVWKFSDAELVPLRMFVVAEKVGGQVIGAFDGSDLVGFALAVPGIRLHQPYLHSHMLAVRASHQNLGLGSSLKLFQRDEAVARGIDLIEWTFDPLEIKNAYLNIEKLGAIARRYNVNQYGITSSPLQAGLPTDRLIAEWWLRSERVQLLLQHHQRSHFETEQSISVPGAIDEWKSSPESSSKASAIQTRNRQLFQEFFSQGLAVLGYQRETDGSGTFHLGKLSFQDSTYPQT